MHASLAGPLAPDGGGGERNKRPQMQFCKAAICLPLLSTHPSIQRSAPSEAITLPIQPQRDLAPNPPPPPPSLRALAFFQALPAPPSFLYCLWEGGSHDTVVAPPCSVLYASALPMLASPSRPPLPCHPLLFQDCWSGQAGAVASAAMGVGQGVQLHHWILRFL